MQNCRNKIKMQHFKHAFIYFTYLLYSKLIRIGLERVYMCTKKRDVEVIRKDCAFVTITQNGYFSSCIICNPSLIPNINACNNKEKGTHNDLLMPCMLHFNSSFNYHISNNTAKHI